MAKGIVLAGIIIIVALAVIFLSEEFTGKTIEGACSGTNTYYLCIDGDGDFVLDGTAVPLGEINETVEIYDCKSVNLENNEYFVFRYTNNAVKGLVYNSNKELIGSNNNEHAVANYKCSLEGDCSLSCSEYLVWE